VRPKELTVDFYLDQPSKRKLSNYRVLLDELQEGDPHPEEIFDKLWRKISERNDPSIAALLNNGLTDEENRNLLETTDTLEAVCWVWHGMTKAFGMAAKRG
jgi:hypothetical protein